MKKHKHNELLMVRAAYPVKESTSLRSRAEAEALGHKIGFALEERPAVQLGFLSIDDPTLVITHNGKDVGLFAPSVNFGVLHRSPEAYVYFLKRYFDQFRYADKSAYRHGNGEHLK